jgi:D-amino-acid dehydrogenase
VRAVVIGSGVAGAATAFALARRGVAVTVVAAEHEGTATAAGAGIIAPWATALAGPSYRLYAAGAAFYPTLVERLAAAGVAEVGYHRAGAVVVDADERALDAIAQRLAERRADAPAMGTVERVTGRDVFPPLSAELHGLFLSGGARVDGRALRAGLLSAAQRLGAHRVAASAQLDRDGTVRLDGERLRADAVVVAAGAWTNELLAPLAVRLPVAPQRGQLVHLQLAVAATAEWPAVLPAGSHYLVPFAAGRVVVGATRETGSGFDARVTAAGLHEVLASALRVAPGLADASVLETRVGLRPLAEGRWPLLAEVAPGVHVVTGLGSAGLTMGPLVGELCAARLTGEGAAFDLAPFDPAG